MRVIKKLTDNQLKMLNNSNAIDDAESLASKITKKGKISMPILRLTEDIDRDEQ